MIGRSQKKEILDAEIPEPGVFLKVMNRLAWQNRITGHNYWLFKSIQTLIGQRKSLTVLDVGTGLGDIPKYLSDKFTKAGVEARITGVDTNKQVIDLAVQESSSPTVSFVCQRMEDLPGTFDVVIASQMIHHLDPEEAVAFFRAAYAKANIGVIVSDFSRSWLASVLVKLFMYVTFADRINRHDGPLSVLRAYTKPELADMLGRAGIANYKFRNFFFRKIIIIPK